MSSIQWIIAHCRENLTTLRRTRKRVTVLPREKHLNRDTDLWMTRVSQVARRFGKAQAVWQTGWPSLHTRMGRKPMQTLPRNFSPEHSLKILYCTKCFERRSPETIKPKLEDILCTVADHCTTFHSPTNEKSGECTNDVYACFVNLEEHTKASRKKHWDECCGSGMLTATCYCLWKYCTPARKFVSVSDTTTVHCVCWTSTRVSTVTVFLLILYELDRQSYPSRPRIVGSCWINRLLFTYDLVLPAFSE